LHSEADLDHLTAALETLWAQCQLARMPRAAE